MISFLQAIERFFAIIWYVITWPFRMLGQLPFFRSFRLRIGLAGLSAILMFVFLLSCVGVVTFLYYSDPYRVPWGYSWTSQRAIAIGVLVVVIPFVVWYTVRLWLEGDTSAYPEIDYAWKAGLDELKKNGLDIKQVPLFLVLGSRDENFEKAFFEASGLNLRIAQTPDGPAALHWYANAGGIYLVCSSETSVLSYLGSKENEPTEEVAGGEAFAEMPLEAAPPQAAAPQPAAAPPPPQPQPPHGGTMVLPQTGGGGLASLVTPPGPPGSGGNPPAPQPPPPPGGPPHGGTMMLPAQGGQGSLAAMAGASPQPQQPQPRAQSYASAVDFAALATPEMTRKPVTLSAQEATEKTRRLEYLCHLIRRARSPLCPVNGILTLLPFGIIRRGPREGAEVQKAVKTDLGTVNRTLQVRCPVTALVTGMEAETGFRELVRRVGQERAAVQRFGKGSELGSPTTVEQMVSLSAHACKAFESWIYALFREPGALHKPGNTKLYALLCQVRRYLQGTLAQILAEGYGYDPHDEDDEGGEFYFGGCYFAAVGDTPDRQAFVKGVVDKLIDQQEEVEWTDDALERERSLQWSSNMLLLLNFALVITLGVLIGWNYFGE